MKCEKCGKELVEGALYCPECGNKVEQEEKIVCPKCGKELEEGSNFCPKCGFNFNKKFEKLSTNAEFDIFVSKNKNADYSSINEAVENADEGDIIFIDSGIYEECVSVYENIILIGNEKNKPIIVQPEDFEYSGLFVGENAEFKNIIFESKDGKGIDDSCAMVGIMANSFFEDCEFRKNYFTGIYVGTDEDNDIGQEAVEVSFYNCSFSEGNDEVLGIEDEAIVNLVNCKFFNNKDNIKVYDDAFVYLDNCDIKNSGNGICAYDDCSVYISNTLISHLNTNGIYADDTASVLVVKSNISYCDSLCFITGEADGKLINCSLSNYKCDAVSAYKQGVISVINCDISDGNEKGIYIPNKSKGVVMNCHFSNIDKEECIFASDDSVLLGNKRD